MNEGRRLLVPPPDVPGLAFRSFRGETDYPGMVRVINAACRADDIERVESVEAMAGLAFKSSCAAAVLLTQRLIGAKSFRD